MGHLDVVAERRGAVTIHVMLSLVPPGGASPSGEAGAMNHRQIIESCLAKVLAKLPDERLREVFDFARFLALKEEHTMWSSLGAEALAEMYADEEDDYTEADIKTDKK